MVRNILCVVIFSLFGLSCQERPHRVDNRRIVASVGDRLLLSGEVTRSLPDGLQGVDSAEFAALYVERWIARQVKWREAERIFSAAVPEVEAMVASYRNALLTQKLDKYYIDSSQEAPFSHSDILGYYKENMSSFRLSKSIVKGVIVRLPKDYAEAKKVETMMKVRGEEGRLNFLSMCEKSEGIYLKEVAEWLEYDEFIEMLPIVRDRGADVYMRRDGVQRLQDGDNIYLFEIEAYRSAGYVAPLEWVESSIGRILTSKYQQGLIQERERRLYQRAAAANIIKRYNDDNVVSGDDESKRTTSRYPSQTK